MARPVTYRDLQAPTLVDTTRLETGDSEVAAQLARSLKSFERGLGEVGFELRSQQGAREGAEAALTDTFAPRTGLAATTAYGQAYNSAGAAAYMAKSATDIEATLDRLEQESPGDPDKFAAAASGYADGLLKSAPRDFQPRLQQLIAARTAAGLTRLRGQQIAEVQSSQIADYERGADASAKLALKSLTEGVAGDAALASAIQDNEAQLAALVRDKVLMPHEAERYRQKFAAALDDALAGAKLAGAVEDLMAAARADVEAGDRALAALQEREDLDAHDKIAIAEEYRRQRGLLEYERSRVHVNEAAELARELAAGGHGTELESRARHLYKRGAISGEEFENVLEQSTRNEAKSIEDQSDVATVLASLQLGRGIDPADAKQRKALDKLFVAETTRLGEVPGSERWQAHAVELARTSNVLPESAASWARVQLTSGDPVAASVAAGFMRRVQDANPVAAPYNDEPKLGSLIEKLNANLNAGLEPERAYTLAMQSSYLLTEAQRKELAERYKELKVARGNLDALEDLAGADDQFDPGLFSSVPTIPAALAAEYGSLVQQYFIASGGNVQQSRALAYRAIKSLWGLTRVNGELEIMKYAPERLGLPTEIIRRDIADSVAPLGLDASKVKLVPNAATERTRGQVWFLGIENKYGAVDIVLGPDNRPLQYRLPLGDAFERTRAAVREEKIAAARRRRALELENAQTQTELERRYDEYVRNNPRDMTLRR